MKLRTTFSVQGRMEKLKPLLLSEVYSAKTYLDRLLFVFFDQSKLYQEPKFERALQCFHFDLMTIIEAEFLGADLTNDEQDDQAEFNIMEIRSKIKNSFQFLEAVILLQVKEEALLEKTSSMLNLIYRYCHEFHSMALEWTKLDIAYPRLNLISMCIQDVREHDTHVAPLFQLNIEDVRDMLEECDNVTGFLNWQREKKYDFFVKQGHLFISEQQYEKALDQFKKAFNYKESAEILTLIGWANALLGKREEAKNCCLKAMKMDPNFGPSYNDFGTYLFNEGQIQESIKWFQMAKKATHYTHREYPYINAGRAYISLHQYEKAIDEFSYALTLAPYHEELHQTIAKLKEKLNHINQQDPQELNL